MANVIAEIRLAPGEVGYYDDYSRIYLNSARPTAKIYAGTNTTQIRKSIRSGRLRLISGSLNAVPVKTEPKPVKPEVKAEEVAPVMEEPVPEVKEEVKVETVETPIIETEPAVEIETVETVTTEAPAEEAEEAPKPRRGRRKKAE